MSEESAQFRVNGARLIGDRSGAVYWPAADALIVADLHLEKGSAFYAPAASGVEMAESYLKDLKKQLPCAVYLNGEYGTKDIYAGVPVIIGSGGVEKIVEIELSSDERKNFEKSIEAVKDLFNAAKNIDKSLS